MERADRVASVVTLVALVLVAAALTLLHVEEGLGLPRLMPLVVVGFAIHSWLPTRFRIPFFLLLGLAGSLLLFGPVSSLLLFGAGSALIGVCHLPIPRWARVGVLLTLAAGLAMLRVGWVEAPGAATVVVPVLASMFMFRLIIYLYDLPHERQPVPLQTRLAYFFMLPNLVFPLFPVVDYQRFTSGHYAREADGIHRKGVGWMLLGTLQILAYRGIHMYLVPDSGSIRDVEDVVLSGVTAYLQYLRISGMFHIAAGILCLFGFDLPATNRWFFFASSYTDLWRRINVYWKDFLQKTVYFPVFMRFRKRGTTRALVLATVAVFVSSWFLHAWQWFWLQGEVVISDVDLAFWALVGAGVVVSALMDARKKPTAVAPRPPLQQAIARTASTALLFSATCVLWSLWSSHSLQEWFFVVGRARYASPQMVARMGAVAATVLVGGLGLSWLHVQGRLPDPEPLLRRGSALIGAGGALMLLGLGAPQLPDDSPVLAMTLETREGPLGYYEGLLEGDMPPERRAMVPQLPGEADGERVWEHSHLYPPTNDLRRYEMRPSTAYVLNGRRFRTNEHGMRDVSVSLARTPGVVRVALLGASPEAGFGVAAGKEYPAVLDRQLGPTVEVLNFAVVGYGPVQNVAALEKALAFDPDVVLLMNHGLADRALTLRLLAILTEKGRVFPPELHDFAPPTFRGFGPRRAWVLSQYEPLTRWAYERIAARSREHGAVPVWVHVPLPGDPPGSATPTEIEDWAREAGFDTLLLEDVFRGHDRADLTLGAGDTHPNPTAHRIIATHLAPLLEPWTDP